jgi:hypothetical protein
MSRSRGEEVVEVSILQLPRLVFSGYFQADVSTVNNDVRHYDDDTFEPRFQEPGAGTSANGWWNPTGSGAFRLLDCVVQDVVYGDGTAGRAGDEPVLGMALTGADARASGKLVDLDPQWQLSSEIWGLGVRLADAGGSVLEADFEPASFRDILFGRQAPGPNGQTASAVYTSRLTGLRRGRPDLASRWLDELLAACDDGSLAIRFTTFGYHTNAAHPRFTLGRLLGAIGPGGADQPRRFLLGRRLAPEGERTDEGLTFLDAVVDPVAGQVRLDLGNALPILDPEGTLAPVGPLAVAVLRTPDAADGTPGVRERAVLPTADVVLLGHLDLGATDWLARTAGIVDVDLPAAAAALIADHPLALVAPDGATVRVVLRETFGGMLVRADDAVLRVDADPAAAVPATVRCWAARWGEPLDSTTIAVSLLPPIPGLGSGPPNDPNPPTAPIPLIGTPQEAMTVPATAVTDARGCAELTLTIRDPQRPRGYLDGQIYLIGYQLPEQDPAQQHQFDLVVVHVRDGFTAPVQPTWVDDIQPLLAPYGNLYPIMSRRLVDLGDYDALREHAAIVELAFGRPLEDPNHMPVSRELSAAKRAMVLAWLRDRNSYGERRMLYGPRPAAPPPAPPDRRQAGAAVVAEPEAVVSGEIGGKSVVVPQTRDRLAEVRGKR